MRHIGKRGTLLLLFAGVFFLIGVKALFDPQQDEGRFLLYSQLPTLARGVLWWVPSIIAVYSVFHKKSNDALAFFALSVPAVTITFSYLFSTVGFLFGVTTYGLGWANSLSWIMVVGILYIVSGWAEQPEDADTNQEKGDGGT